MRSIASAACVAVAFALAGCAARPVAQHEGHIRAESPPATSSIPQPVRSVPLPPPPEAREPEIRYSVVVANQPVRDVLLAMARETKVNFDIHPGVEGTVNLNAIDQTLKQILTRIARQVDVRWETDGQTITVMPDTPYLRIYRIDYVNMSRDVAGTIGVQANVVAPPGAAGGNLAASRENTSMLKVDNTARNRFWETLEKNIKDLLRETDKQLPEGSAETYVRGPTTTAGRGTPTTTTRQTTTPSGARGATTTTTSTSAPEPPNQPQEFVEQRLTFREAASVIVSPETGVVSVRATSRQHEKVAEFIGQIMGAARRQVLIEATVVEVTLNDNYQGGVDWSSVRLDNLGYSFTQSFLGTRLSAPPFFAVEYNNPNAPWGGSIQSTVKLLDSFGNTRVLSSPKIMALNNQTAVLKVVDNRVYFTVQAQVTPAQGNAQPLVVFTTTQNVVPVGFIMNVTPQIAENDMVVLNVRPSVSRIVGTVRDPNPDLARANVENLVPEIQSREFESVLRVPSGRVAILGGLMQDSFDYKTDGLPILSRIPLVRDAVSYRNDTTRKTELVIFLRPIVIRDASIEGDLAEYRRYLPDREFFRDQRPLVPELERTLERAERGNLRLEVTPNPVVPPPPRTSGESP